MKNLYSMLEVEMIFNACRTFEECSKVCDDFLWLIAEGWQFRTPHLYEVSNRRLHEILKP